MEQTKLDAAAATLATTRRAQEAAVADVEAVYKGEVDRVVALRLRVVDEAETATKVIGRRSE